MGVNYADCVVRMGLYASAKKYVGWPITPGFEVAGTVRSTGAEVRGVTTGDRVLAITRFGGYATALCVPAHQVFPIPPSWTPEQAAAFPSVHMTAFHALHQLTQVKAGQVVLVHSAAGGVGSALLRLCALANCTSIAVVGGAHKVAHARACGANHVIDTSSENLWERVRTLAPHGVDVVLDANGVRTLRDSYAALASCGKLIVYGFHSMLPRRGGRPNPLRLAWDWLRTPRFNPLTLTGDNKSVLAFNLSYLFERTDLLQEGMTTLLAHAVAGRLPPPEVQIFPFDDVAKAHALLESGTTVGKLVLKAC